jgi:ribosomal-protein-alanine N-acetyltransferase
MSRMPTQTKSHIRPMTADDLDAVLAIEQASFPNPWRREHFEHEIAALYSFPFVADHDGIVVGYVCLMSLFEEAQILDIAVAPEQRGRGVARILMDYAIYVSREKDAEVLVLEVRASNIAAITLYERCGFVRTGIRSKYYEGVDDAVLMEKNLK